MTKKGDGAAQDIEIPVSALYDSLLALTGSVVAVLNRALALSKLRGPEAGLQALQAVAGDPRLEDYQPYWAARADLCDRAGRLTDAEAAYLRAIGLEMDPAVRVSLQDRLAAMVGRGGFQARLQDIAR